MAAVAGFLARSRWKDGSGFLGWLASEAGAFLHRAPRRIRRGLPMVPGVAGAVLASAGGGEVIGHVFGRGLAPWCALVIGSVFLLRLGAELNRAPAVPPSQDG